MNKELAFHRSGQLCKKKHIDEQRISISPQRSIVQEYVQGISPQRSTVQEYIQVFLTFMPRKFAIPCTTTAGANSFQRGVSTPSRSRFAKASAVIAPQRS
jgi:hypothetical protein